jgi:two-component system, OmpR family, phosphate regulon sensor histidine kinase PhoR
MAAVAWILFAVAALALVALGLQRRREKVAGARSADSGGDPAATPPPDAVRGRTAFEVTPRVALLVDSSGRLLDANRAARDRFPFLQSHMGLLEAFGNHEIAGGVMAALAAMEGRRFDVRLFAEGRHTYSVTVEPYEVNGAAEALVFLADTTEEVEYQELRSQFVANVSHELRTPLAGLRGMLEGLEDVEMPPETRARFAGRARHEAERLEALIADILFLSELEAMQGTPSGAVSDLSPATRAAADDLEDQAHIGRVEVEVTAPDAAWTALTDRMARTVASNLLENAVRYSGPGSHVTAAVRQEDGRVVLEVSDDGAGIPERHLPHIFERFYRADPSRSKELGGTGLGLSIVKHIVDRFGGTVEARSREGFGTTITIVLPAVDVPLARSEDG